MQVSGGAQGRFNLLDQSHCSSSRCIAARTEHLDMPYAQDAVGGREYRGVRMVSPTYRTVFMPEYM